MGSTDQLQNPTRRRLKSWALVVALLSIAGLLFWVFVFVDSFRRSTGWELGRPVLFLIGALLISVGVAGSCVAANLAWVRPSRSKLMALAATLGLIATCMGGFLMVRSFSFFYMPGMEITQEYESSDESSIRWRTSQRA